MSDNKDLEDRINELEKAKLQKRIAELEAELGAKPNVKEEPAGRITGQEKVKAAPITKRTRKQNWVYRLGKLLFLLLPLFVFLFYFFTGDITLWNISSENIIGSSRDISLYIVGGFVAYFIIMELIWMLIIHIIFGRMEGGMSKGSDQGVKPVDPVARSANKVGFYLIPGVLVIIIVAFVLFGKSLFPKINFTGSPLGSGPNGIQYWKGAFPVTLTQWGHGNAQEIANIGGGGSGGLTFQPAIAFSGVPWMVLGYDKVSLKITTVVFGLSEVTYEVLNGVPLYTDPCMSQGEEIQGADKLDLKGCILILPPGIQVTNGVQQFSFTDPLGSNGFTFVYTSDNMEGTATILKVDNWFYPYSSEANAIKLYRK